MDKTTLFSFFEEKIKVKIREFCEKINDSNPDIYILMARKAACFVSALEQVSLINLSGKVISERLLDTNLNWRGIKTITIIDDVIISGTTLNRTINKLKKINPSFEIKVIVIGINEKWFNPELLQNEKGDSYMELPYKPLENSQCIKLSGDIVRMLSVFPIPYNIDFPIYQTIKLTQPEYQNMLYIPGWEVSDISSLPQKKENVFTLTFKPYEEHLELAGKLFNNELLNESLIKIRIYGRKNIKKKEVYSFSLVPIIILPPITKENIQSLFDYFSGNENAYLSQVLDSFTSKLRFIQFIIADRLAALFLNQLSNYTKYSLTLERKYSSLRLLFPEEIIENIIKIADYQLLDVNILYIKYDIGLKKIKNPYPLNDFININNALNKPFLDIYYNSEIPARKLALINGKNVFEIKEYSEHIERLNRGYSLLDLDNILISIPKETRNRLLSTYLDKAIDNGIVVPITVVENNHVYRAFRHGEDVQFGQREERLCLEMFNAFANQINRVDFQKIWIEKLLVFFLKIGEAKFLEPIQTEINSYNHINGKEKNISDVASVRYFLQGPIVVKRKVDLNKKYDFNPCLDFSDKSTWLSRYFINNNNSLKISKNTNLYNFDKDNFLKQNRNDSENEIIIEKESVKKVVEIGTVFGMLINNSIQKNQPSINSDELVALSSCCEPKDVIGALAAEINIVLKVWTNSNPSSEFAGFTSLKVILNDAYDNNARIANAIKLLHNNPIYRAINDGQRKFEWYIKKHPQIIINRILNGFSDIVYQGIWESFWSPNIDWSETSEKPNTITTAITEGIWLLCANIYFLISEYCLLTISNRNVESEKIFIKILDFNEKCKFYASNVRTKEIIPFASKFIDNKDSLPFITKLFPETIEKIDKLVFSAVNLVKDAEVFFTNYQMLPEIKFFTSALYIETETGDSLKDISNIFQSICFKISKTSEDNFAFLKNLPNYDNIIGEKTGRWYVGSGKSSGFWLLQFAQEVINNLGYKFNYKIFLFPNIPNECAVKIIDDYKINYHSFWVFVTAFSDFIAKTPYQNKIFHSIRESSIKNSILNEFKDRFPGYQLQQETVKEIRIPNLTEFLISRYINMGKLISKSSADIGILTIVTEEMQAVLSEFSIDIADYKSKENRFFYEKDYNFNDNTNKKIVVLQSSDLGNLSIINAYQSLVRNYELDYVVLLGIAGSIQAKVKLCDVLIGTNVIYYEKNKEVGKDILERRGEFFNLSFRMLQILNYFFTKHSEPSVLVSCDDSISNTFNVTRGPIGSGEAIVADPLSKTKEWLLSVNSKTAVVETEAAGFCKAFFETNTTEDLTVKDIILIRGISDHADFDKDDKWRLPSSRNAVKVLKKIVELLYQ